MVGKDSHTAHFATIKDAQSNIIDEVLITIFSKGKSFTGEEIAEIGCHGSPFIQQQIIQILLAKGLKGTNQNYIKALPMYVTYMKAINTNTSILAW